MPDTAPDSTGKSLTSAAPDTSAPARSSLFIGSTEKTFQVLQAFDGPHRHMTLADIARVAGLDRSAAQRVVYTLETLGYLRRVNGTRHYGLTPKVLQFSYNYIRANELIDKASPYLLDVSRTLGETTNLQEIDGNEIVFTARFPGRHMVNIDFVVGSRLPALFTASGTAILAGLSDSRRREILAATELTPLTPYTETSPAALLRRIDVAATTGYAICVNETVMGDISVAAAIADQRGVPIAAVNVSVPTTRWTRERAEAELVPHVQVAAAAISQAKITNPSSG